jgi:uncharacterized membrane protein YfcA
MKLIPTLCDSRGKQSITLFFVAVAFGAVVYKFISSDMSGTDFGVAVGAVLGIWLGREWTEKIGGQRAE